MNKIDVDNLRLKFNIDTFVSKYLPELRKNSKYYNGRCPLAEHKDKRPSFGLCHSGDYKGLWFCSCGRGNIVTLLMKLRGLDFKSALSIIQLFVENNEDDFVSLSEAANNVRRILRKKLGSNSSNNKSLLPPSRRHKTFMLKYLMTKRDYSFEDSLKIIYEYNMTVVVEPKFYGWLLVPIYDINHNQVSWMAQHPFKKKSDKLNPPGHSMDFLFNINKIPIKKEWVIVVESIWCAIRLFMWGFPSVATFGARLSDEQAKLICKRFNRVYLCYDNDKAGRKAEKIAVKKLKPQLILNYMSLESEDPDKATEQEISKAIISSVANRSVFENDNKEFQSSKV